MPRRELNEDADPHSVKKKHGRKPKGWGNERVRKRWTIVRDATMKKPGTVAKPESSDDPSGIFRVAVERVLTKRTTERRVARLATHNQVFSEIVPDNTFEWSTLGQKLQDYFSLSMSSLPICIWSKRVNGRRLSYDLVAGISVGVLLVPQAMAYALLVGIPPIHGLYSSLVPVWAHALITSSSKLSPGPGGPTSILIGQVVTGIMKEDADNVEERLRLVGMLTMLSGMILLAAGLLRLGFVASVLSWPVMSGFSTAAGIITAASQLHHLFGVDTPSAPTAIEDLINFFANLGSLHVPTTIVGCTVIFVLIGWKYLHLCKLSPCTNNESPPPAWIPVQLLAVIVTIIVSAEAGLEAQGVSVVGKVAEGFPAAVVPNFSLNEVGKYIGQAAVIGMVAYVGTITQALAFAKKGGETIRPSIELAALGAGALTSSVFQGWAPSSSFTRTAVMSELGARTPIASMVTALLVLIVLLAVGPLIAFLPQATLAAMVISSVKSLLKFDDAAKMFRTKMADFVQFAATLILTLALGIQTGIILAVAVSLATLLARTFQPRVTELWRLPNTDHFVNAKRYPAAKPIDGIMILRADGELNFGNIKIITNVIRGVIAASRNRKEEVEEARRILRLGGLGLPSSTDVPGLRRSESSATVGVPPTSTNRRGDSGSEVEIEMKPRRKERYRSTKPATTRVVVGSVGSVGSGSGSGGGAVAPRQAARVIPERIVPPPPPPAAGALRPSAIHPHQPQSHPPVDAGKRVRIEAVDGGEEDSGNTSDDEGEGMEIEEQGSGDGNDSGTSVTTEKSIIAHANHWAAVGQRIEMFARPPLPIDPELVAHLGPNPIGDSWIQDPLDIKAIILDGSRVPSVDTTACLELLSEIKSVKKLGYDLLLAGFPGPVRDTLERFGVLSEDHVPLFFLSIMSAVEAAKVGLDELRPKSVSSSSSKPPAGSSDDAEEDEEEGLDGSSTPSAISHLVHKPRYKSSSSLRGKSSTLIQRSVSNPTQSHRGRQNWPHSSHQGSATDLARMLATAAQVTVESRADKKLDRVRGLPPTGLEEEEEEVYDEGAAVPIPHIAIPANTITPNIIEEVDEVGLGVDDDSDVSPHAFVCSDDDEPQIGRGE